MRKKIDLKYICIYFLLSNNMNLLFKRGYHTMTTRLFTEMIGNNGPKTFTDVSTNSLMIMVKKTINNIINRDIDGHLPKLHRWCNNTSPRYKDTCDWEKKLEIASRDNCYTDYNKNFKNYI